MLRTNLKEYFGTNGFLGDIMPSFFLSFFFFFNFVRSLHFVCKVPQGTSLQYDRGAQVHIYQRIEEFSYPIIALRKFTNSS